MEEITAQAPKEPQETSSEGAETEVLFEGGAAGLRIVRAAAPGTSGVGGRVLIKSSSGDHLRLHRQQIAAEAELHAWLAHPAVPRLLAAHGLDPSLSKACSANTTGGGSDEGSPAAAPAALPADGPNTNQAQLVFADAGRSLATAAQPHTGAHYTASNCRLAANAALAMLGPVLALHAAGRSHNGLAPFRLGIVEQPQQGEPAVRLWDFETVTPAVGSSQLPACAWEYAPPEAHALMARGCIAEARAAATGPAADAWALTLTVASLALGRNPFDVTVPPRRHSKPCQQHGGGGAGVVDGGDTDGSSYGSSYSSSDLDSEEEEEVAWTSASGAARCWVAKLPKLHYERPNAQGAAQTGAPAGATAKEPPGVGGGGNAPYALVPGSCWDPWFADFLLGYPRAYQFCAAWRHVPTDLRHFIRSGLQRRRSKRATVQDLAGSAWVLRMLMEQFPAAVAAGWLPEEVLCRGPLALWRGDSSKGHQTAAAVAAAAAAAEGATGDQGLQQEMQFAATELPLSDSPWTSEEEYQGADMKHLEAAVLRLHAKLIRHARAEINGRQRERRRAAAFAAVLAADKRAAHAHELPRLLQPRRGRRRAAIAAMLKRAADAVASAAAACRAALAWPVREVWPRMGRPAGVESPEVTSWEIAFTLLAMQGEFGAAGLADGANGSAGEGGSQDQCYGEEEEGYGCYSTVAAQWPPNVAEGGGSGSDCDGSNDERSEYQRGRYTVVAPRAVACPVWSGEPISTFKRRVAAAAEAEARAGRHHRGAVPYPGPWQGALGYMDDSL